MSNQQSKVQISINTPWSSARFTRPGSGNLVYGSDADPFCRNMNDNRKLSKKYFYFGVLVIILLPSLLAYLKGMQP